jgi:hypothetical protein
MTTLAFRRLPQVSMTAPTDCPHCGRPTLHSQIQEPEPQYEQWWAEQRPSVPAPQPAPRSLPSID